VKAKARQGKARLGKPRRAYARQGVAIKEKAWLGKTR
jgi:hypothetical protein